MGVGVDDRAPCRVSSEPSVLASWRLVLVQTGIYFGWREPRLLRRLSHSLMIFLN